MLRSLVTAAALAALTLPAAAQAGEPFTIGEGSDPHIVMNSVSDAARIVWSDDVADKVHFCALPKGATACSLHHELDAPPGGPDRAFLVNTSSAKVYIAMPHYASDKTYLYQSSNGGMNFSGPTVIYGAADGTDEFEPVLNNAQNELVFPSFNPARYIHSAALNASEAGGSAVAVLPTGGISDLQDLQVARSVAVGNSLVALAHNGTNSYFWHLTSGDPSNAASWAPAPTPIGEGADARLAPGDGNPWMMASAGPIGGKRIEVRKWNGSAFGAPTVLANEQGYMPDIATQGGDIIGAAWRKNDSDPANRLRFALSTNGGTSWSTSTIAFDDAVMASMDLGLGADGKGFAVYEGKSTPSSGAKRFIRVASTDTVPEPVKPTTTTTTATTTPTTTTPPKTTTTTPPPPKKTTPVVPLVRSIAAAVRGATISLGLPTQCIPAGQPFVATLTWKKQKRKGNLFVKVNRADFFIGSKQIKSDKKAPFTQTLRIPSPKRGESYRFRARATIKVRRGKAPKKSIFATLKVCA